MVMEIIDVKIVMVLVYMKVENKYQILNLGLD